MSRSTGLAPRRGYSLDALTVLVGAVAAGARGRVAETRTGAERLLNTRLEAQDVFKLVAHGQSSNSAGGYIIQAAHVAEGSTTPSTYATIGTVTLAPGIQEIPLSGAVVGDLCRKAPSPDITGDVRVTAVRLIPGSGALTISNVVLTDNVATVTVGAHSLLVGEVVTIFCSNAVFDGVFTITAKAATTISFAKENANVSTASATGTVTNGLAVPAGTNTISLQHA
jgi:hypothetical protein